MLHRGRTSKTQINVVRLKFGHLLLDWPAEIQSMLTKNGPTVAECMFRVLTEMLSQVPMDLESSTKQRVVCLVIADSLPTNLLASKILWTRFRGDPHFDIRLVHWGCASHQVSCFICKKNKLATFEIQHPWGNIHICAMSFSFRIFWTACILTTTGQSCRSASGRGEEYQPAFARFANRCHCSEVVQVLDASICGAFCSELEDMDI